MFFSFKKEILIIFFAIASFTSCNAFVDDIAQGFAGVLVGGISGEIVHKKGLPHTYRGDFVFTRDSHAIVTLTEVINSESSRTVQETTINGINRFPIKFFLKLNERLNPSANYTIRAKVFSERGNTSQEGDLVTESVVTFQAKQKSVRLEVTGLESCASKGSGGFCI